MGHVAFQDKQSEFIARQVMGAKMPVAAPEGQKPDAPPAPPVRSRTLFAKVIEDKLVLELNRGSLGVVMAQTQDFLQQYWREGETIVIAVPDKQ